MFTSMYKDVAEDFAGEDAANLDTWVFGQVREFFNAARSNDTLKKMLSQGQIVFFLHLLGKFLNIVFWKFHVSRPFSIGHAVATIILSNQKNQ